MSYTILKTDGSPLTDVVDGNIDQTSTDLTLIGKNSSTYGVFINENFVYLLENFANISAPNNPVLGQLWYDSSEARLKVYDGAGFKVTSGTIVSNTVPDSFGQGDLWIDSFRRQLYFHDGTSLVLAGPIYTEQQGVTGFNVAEIVDINGITHTVLLLYVSQILIGIFSKSKFRPANSIDGYDTATNPRFVEIGFNAGNYAGIAFDTTVTRAESLIDSNGNIKYVEDFVVASAETVSISGSLYVKADEALILGSGQSSVINASLSLFELSSNNTGQNFRISTIQPANGNIPGGIKSNLFINATTQYIGLHTDEPTTDVDVNGDVKIRGNLTVDGETLSINSTIVQVDDKSIELGVVTSPTDITANGGGIILKGSTDKTFTWNSSPVSAWTSTENVNLAVNKKYYINGIEVLSQTALGQGVNKALGLNEIGTLNYLQSGSIFIQGDTISSVSPMTNRNIIISPKGVGSIVLQSASNSAVKVKIIGLADTDPTNLTNAYDAINSRVLENRLKSDPMGLTFDITQIRNLSDLTYENEYIRQTVLRNVFPIGEHNELSVCRVFCTLSGYSPMVKTFRIVDGDWVFEGDESVPLPV